MGEAPIFKVGLNADLGNSRKPLQEAQGEGLEWGPTSVRGGL